MLRPQARSSMEDLVPFLTAKPSTPSKAPSQAARGGEHAFTILDSAEDAGLWLLSRMRPEEIGAQNGNGSAAELLDALLEDSQALLEPQAIAAAASTAVDQQSGPQTVQNRYPASGNTLAFGLDLWSLFDRPASQRPDRQDRSKQRPTHVQAKLAMYLARYLHSLKIPSSSRTRVDLSQCIAKERRRLKREMERAELEEGLHAKHRFEAQSQQSPAHGAQASFSRAPLIESLEPEAPAALPPTPRPDNAISLIPPAPSASSRESGIEADKPAGARPSFKELKAKRKAASSAPMHVPRKTERAE